MVAGLVYIGIGVSFVMAGNSEARNIALHYAFLLMPQQAWGCVFVAAGLTSVISSRWPPISETWGYIVLTSLSAGWAAFYAVGIIFYESPSTNFSGAMTWGLVAFMWWAISGLVNPPAVVMVVPTKEDVQAILNDSNVRKTDVYFNKNDQGESAEVRED